MLLYVIAHMDEDDYNLNTDSVYVSEEGANDRMQAIFEDHKDHKDEDGNETDKSEFEVQCFRCMHIWHRNYVEVRP
jgi:hypothetical protein